MRNIFIVFMLFMSASLFGGAPEVSWTRTIGGFYFDYGHSVKQTTDGGYITCGGMGSGGGDFYIWLLKTNALGQSQWGKFFGGSGNSMGYSVSQTKDSGYVLCGFTNCFSGYTNAWLIKVNANGVKEWDRVFSGLLESEGYSVQQTMDGGYMMAGGFSPSSGPIQEYMWLVKVDSSGDSIWAKTYGGMVSQFVRSAQQTMDSGYIMCGPGTNYSGEPGTEICVIKTNSNGDSVWGKTFGGPYSDDVFSIQETSDSGYILCGHTYLTDYDVRVIKLDKNGDVLWDNLFGDSKDEEGNAVRETPDGGYIICGRTYPYGGGKCDVWLIKLAANGEKIWDKFIGGSNIEICNSIELTSDNGYIMTGYKELSSGGDRDLWLVKTGCHKWTILVYLNGDNNLEWFAIQDINEMERGIDSASNYNILVQVDRHPDDNVSEGYDGSNGDWTGTRRYYITPDTSSDDSIRSPLLEDMGELNMGDPHTLVDFGQTGIKGYPADNYMLVVWDHGNGWYKGAQDIIKGISYDATNSDYLGVADDEYAGAMDTISSFLGDKIDIIANDACLMGMHEVAYEVKDFADFIVSSEYTIPGDGYPYDAICDSLNKNDSLTPEELARTIVDKYKTFYEGSRNVTLSTVALDSRFDHLSYCIDEFAKALMSNGGRLNPDIDTIRLNTLEFMENPPCTTKSDSCHIDLYDFANRISNNSNLSAQTRGWADSVMSAISSAVVREGHVSNTVNFDSARGIAIYYPTLGNSMNYNYILLSFTQELENWFRFINGEQIGIDNGQSTPSVFNLQPLFPNPVSSEVTVRYGIPRNTNLSLGLYDLTGREVRSIYSGKQRAGYHTVKLSTSGLPNGIYFLRLKTDSFIKVQKLTILR